MTTKKFDELGQERVAKETAAKLIDSGEIKKIPLQKVQFYSCYMQGMRDAYMKLFPKLIAASKKSERPYLEAEYKLLTSCIDACYDYQKESYELRYRNHKRNKKGDLVSCEAYFVRRSATLMEVQYTKEVNTIIANEELEAGYSKSGLQAIQGLFKELRGMTKEERQDYLMRLKVELENERRKNIQTQETTIDLRRKKGCSRNLST